MITFANLGPLSNNAYVLTAGKNAMIVDAPAEGYRILDFLKKEKLRLKYILVTHGHTDHIVSVNLLKEETNAEIVAHQGDKEMFAKPWNLQFVRADPFKPDILVKDADEIKLGNKRFVALKVVHTPGHTQGSICFYDAKEKAVFTGDTLFAQAIGRTDLPGGDYKQLMKNIREKLLSLPEETKVFPGHGPASIIGQEKAYF